MQLFAGPKMSGEMILDPLGDAHEHAPRFMNAGFTIPRFRMLLLPCEQLCVKGVAQQKGTCTYRAHVTQGILVF